jgi:hypothetical protein
VPLLDVWARAGRCTMHSRPAFAHRAHGGLADPTHFILLRTSTLPPPPNQWAEAYLQPATARTGHFSNRCCPTGGIHVADVIWDRLSRVRLKIPGRRCRPLDIRVPLRLCRTSARRSRVPRESVWTALPSL